MRSHRSGRRRARRRLGVAAALAVAILVLLSVQGTATAASRTVEPRAVGMLDCNGRSPLQRPVTPSLACTDPLTLENGRPDRAIDNAVYVGHDEPITRFISHEPGSANDVVFLERLPRDPARLPTVAIPGHDVTHWFELSVAPWFSMALCNPHSYPLHRCRPLSDANAPRRPRLLLGGGGSSFLETQFYAPGFAPHIDGISCDDRHWCAALHINDLECTNGFRHCNQSCFEPTNFAFIQTNGLPTGPPSPQLANARTATPNRHTLLMNPGDLIRVHVFDAPVPSGGHALEERIDDLTTGQSGFMQASARNGFMATRIKDCSGVPLNYRPEYDTARRQNIVPWTALSVNIATQFEIGHFEPCRRVHEPAPFQVGRFHDTVWQDCEGPYERATQPDVGQNPEFTDVPCYPKGFTHGGQAPPELVTGCAVLLAADLDFDGSSYWPDWPASLRPGRFPSPFLQRQPRSHGRRYGRIQFETTAPASDAANCQPNGQGCQVPLPDSPGQFYPFWTLARVDGHCVWEFGQMRNGETFGETGQYGGPSVHFPPSLAGPVMRNPRCGP